MTAASRFGTVALVGRPNVGKSTLTNRLLGADLSITASRPQTTRHRILGVISDGPVQVALVDTPGIHGRARRMLNRTLNRNAVGALAGVDLVLFMIAAERWTEDDEAVVERLREVNVPVIGIVNRVDQVANKKRLLPELERFSQVLPMATIVPLSARTGDNVDALWREVTDRLPLGEHRYEPDTLTDRSERFLAAELVREQLMRRYGEEVPYSLSVGIDEFETTEDGRSSIAAVIWVERESQKAIVIGRGGERLRDVGTAARQRMQRMFDRPVHLELWVKVRADWPDDQGALRQLGYEEG